MKNKILSLSVVFIFVISSFSAQNTIHKNNPVGKWKFEAPYAPEEYSTGIIDIGLADNKYSAIIMFTGIDYKMPGEKVKFENDTVSFGVYVEGNDVSISLKMDGNLKMVGKAVYSEGEIPLTLSREQQAK